MSAERWIAVITRRRIQMQWIVFGVSLTREIDRKLYTRGDNDDDDVWYRLKWPPGGDSLGGGEGNNCWSVTIVNLAIGLREVITPDSGKEVACGRTDPAVWRSASVREPSMRHPIPNTAIILGMFCGGGTYSLPGNLKHWASFPGLVMVQPCISLPPDFGNQKFAYWNLPQNW